MAKKTNLRAFQSLKGTPRNVVIKLGQKFGPYGRAYHEAGCALAKSFLAEKHSDNKFDVMPIVYLYRHALELHLKGIVLAGNQLMGENGLTKAAIEKLFEKSNGGHGLPHLLTFVQEVFQFQKWPDAIPEKYAPIKTFEDIRALIRDIDKHDPVSMNFRFPTAKDGAKLLLKDHSYSVKGQEYLGYYYQFSMSHFVEVMDPLLYFLDMVVDGLEEDCGNQDVPDY